MKRTTSITSLFILLLAVIPGCKNQEKDPGIVRIHELTYQTPGVDGTMVSASGLVMFPPSGNGPFPMVSCQHGTIFCRKVAPSYLDSCPEAQAWMTELAAKGYVVVMADYIGLGKAGTIPHPYFHAKTEATAARDMIRAAKDFCKNQKIELDDKLFLAGYSQGGHVTASLQRLLEKDHAGEFKITASAIMAAPFDLAMLWDHHVTTPCLISSAVTSLMFKTFFDIYKFGNSYGQFLQKPYDSLVPVMLDYTHPENNVIAALKDPPSAIFSAPFLKEVRDGGHPFALSLLENEVFNWSPKAPTRLVFSMGDEVVPYAIENKAFSRWQELGGNVDSVNLGQKYNHGDGFLPALLEAKKWFDSFLVK
jgi:pimeloyl-ACP methyl ester carboxylesterase